MAGWMRLITQRRSACRLALWLTLVVSALGGSGARAGEMVSLYEFGADEMGYLCLPEKMPQGSVLLVPDALGSRQVVQQRADLLAKLGHVTLVVDLYNGAVSDQPSGASRLQQSLKPPLAVAAVRAGLKLLAESPRYRTERVVAVMWGANLPFLLEALSDSETPRPQAVSWLEPEAAGGVAGLGAVSLPVQLILRHEVDRGDLDQQLALAQTSRGRAIEVFSYDQPRGFLLAGDPSPESVEAWSAMIQFWNEVAAGTYQASVVDGSLPPSAWSSSAVKENADASESVRAAEKVPTSLRSKSSHPRLR